MDLARLRQTLDALMAGKDVSHEKIDEALQYAPQAFDGEIPGLEPEYVGLLKMLWAAYQPPPPPSPPSPSRGIVEQIGEYKQGNANELVLIQDFSTSINNPQACFTLTSMEREVDVAKGRLLNSGQRHLGMVVEVLFTNGFKPSRDKLPVPLTEFVAYRGAFVVLAHCPSRVNFERFCVSAVYRKQADSYERARAAYFNRPVFTLFGALMAVGDSEHGEISGIGMKTGEPMAHAVV